MRNQTVFKLSIGAGLCAAFLVGTAHAATPTQTKPLTGTQKKITYTIKKNGAGFKKGSGSAVALSAEGGCMPDSEVVCVPPDEATEVFYATFQLPGQEIYGRATDDGWTTICTGLECIGFELQEAKNATEDENSNGVIKEAIIRISEVREKEEKACGSVAATSPDPDLSALVSNTTSQSDAFDRDSAAKALWAVSSQRNQLINDFASLSPSTWLDKFGYAADKGYTVTITFSDGGTEQYKFKIGGSIELTQLTGTLVTGSGTSKCPKN